MGHVSITELETYVTRSQGSLDELMLIKAELGHRKTKRAAELKSLVERLLRNFDGG